MLCLARLAIAMNTSVGVTIFFVASTSLPQFEAILNTLTLPGIVTICLAGLSLPPALAYRKIAKVNFAAENAIPSFLRDVTESRKVGLSPVKSVIRATHRRAYGTFSLLTTSTVTL